MPVLNATSVSIVAERWRNCCQAFTKKSASQPEDDRSGQQRHNRTAAGHIHKEHTDHDHRNRQHDSPESPPFQVPVPLPVHPLQLVGRVIIRIGEHIVTALLHGLPEFFRRGLHRVVFNRCGRSRQIDGSRDDARLGIENFFPHVRHIRRSAAPQGEKSVLHIYLSTYFLIFLQTGTSTEYPHALRVLSIQRSGQKGRKALYNSGYYLQDFRNDRRITPCPAICDGSRRSSGNGWA